MVPLISNEWLRQKFGFSNCRLQDLSDLLYAVGSPTGFATLDQFTFADLHEERTTVIPSAPNPWCGCYPTGLEKLPHLNRLIFDQSQMQALELYRFTNVDIVADGTRFAIFRENAVSKESTAVPKVSRREQLQATETVPLIAFCDDQFRPSNPAHFLGDRMTRAFLFKKLVAVREADCFFAGANSNYARYVRSKLCPSARDLPIGRVVRAKTLLLLSSTNRAAGHPFWYMNNEAFDAACNALTPPSQSYSAGPKVFVSRFDTKRRQLTNEAAVAALLKKAGFVIVTMSGLSPSEQFSALSEASVIVGAHGAALTNLVSARPKTRVVELFNPQKGTAAFAAIASRAGMDYVALEGEPLADNTQDSWRINPARVLDAVQD